jgi:hypothetical protein
VRGEAAPSDEKRLPTTAFVLGKSVPPLSIVTGDLLHKESIARLKDIIP